MPLKFFPDFFIVGAPRCGTSALSRYLKEHPQICFSRPKEPHYFVRLSSACSLDDVEHHYLAAYFPHHNSGHKAVGEGSVSYLFSRQAIRLILRFNPDAIFIAMVRNPMDMVYSYYQSLVYVTTEDHQDFESAWNLQEARARGENIPKGCREPRLLQYGQIGKLGEHIGNLFEWAGKERCHVIVFDDFVADTGSVYKKVSDFLNVEDDGRRKFQKKRGKRVYKNRILQRLLYNPPIATEKLVKAWERSTRNQKGKKKSGLKRVRKWLLRSNTTRNGIPHLDEEMRTVLRETFSSDITNLGQLLGRDFSYWR